MASFTEGMGQKIILRNLSYTMTVSDAHRIAGLFSVGDWGVVKCVFKQI